MVLVTIATPLRPTEIQERVVEAATRFFPGQVEVGAHQVRVTTQDIQPLRHRIWELRIIDTFRGQVLHGLRDDPMTTTFRLSKQAAMQNKLSFPPTPHGLGDLVVTVTVQEDDPWDDAEAFAWWLCPETKDGEIVGDTD